MAAVKNIFVICIAVPLLFAALGFPGAAAAQTAIVKRGFNPLAIFKSIGVVVSVITTLVPLLEQLLKLIGN